MKRACFHFAIFTLLLVWSANGSGCKDQPDLMPAPLMGAWEEQGGLRRLNIEPGRTIQREGDVLTVRGLIRNEPGNILVLRNKGLSETWAFKIEEGLLRLEPRGNTQGSNRPGVFRRLSQVPPELKLEPLPLASSSNLPAEKVRAIQNEIKERFESEQALLKQPTPPRDKIAVVQKDNLLYIKDLLKEVGWIDSARFGAKASVQTVIMAKHTHDLRLMMTLLPYAKRDLKDSGDGQTYAVLYDALQLELGQKQLYGTQVAKDRRDGHLYVLPMQESKKEVNRRLAEMGLPDMDEYLSVVSQTFGQKVQCCRQDG